jgi:hypothetical protein
MLKTCFMTMVGLGTWLGGAQAMEDRPYKIYEISSLSQLTPENFEQITGSALDDQTLMGFNVNGTLTKTQPDIREYGYDLVEIWNVDEKMLAAYGRTFASQSEAVSFYRQRLALRLQELGLEQRVTLREESAPHTLDLIHKCGVTSFCLTQREGKFENFTNEAKLYNLSFTLHQHPKIAKKFEGGELYKLEMDGDEVDKSLRTGKHEQRNQSEIFVTYQDNVLYTGWRRIKGLALKTLLHEAQLMPHEDYVPFSKLVFVDDKDKSFDEMYQRLSPYFSQCFFFYLKP